MDPRIFNQLERVLGKGRVKVNVNFSPFLTLKIGSRVPYLFEAESISDWIKAGRICSLLNWKLLVVGGGSNLALVSQPKECLLVRNLYRKKKKIKEDKNYVYLLVSSGYPVTRLVRELIRVGLEGLEYHLGLPGTVGGAIYMNSKWTKPLSYFSDRLEYAYLVGKEGKIKRVSKDYFRFRYGYSYLQESGEILIEAVFKLRKKDPRILLERGKKVLEYRQKTQPIGVYSSGCFFKNIDEETEKRLKLPSRSAGFLIDRAGLKNFRVGDFIVSDKHANFIINLGQGKAEDLKKLVAMIKKTVKEKFGVELQEEVIVY